MAMKNKGFTLLFASLVVSLVLSVGIAIANITLAQLTLSTAGRESQKALYNADTALECALYYQYKVFDPVGNPVQFFPQTTSHTPRPMTCAEIDNDTPVSLPEMIDEAVVVTTYDFNIDSCDPAKPSFSIEVRKVSISGGLHNVEIRTRGYNTCNPENPRRVERGLYAQNIIE
jgi:hypothetical protein